MPLFLQRRRHLECRHFWYALKRRFDISTPLEGVHESCVIVALSSFASPIFFSIIHVETFHYFFVPSTRYGILVTGNEKKKSVYTYVG